MPFMPKRIGRDTSFGHYKVWNKSWGEYPAWEIVFPNGYGASIVQLPQQHGAYEIAVIEASTGRITYSTPITDDVLSWLDSADVEKTLFRISQLPEL